MTRRTLTTVLLVTGAIAAVTISKFAIHPPRSIHAATNTVGPAQSYLIALGVGDTQATVWDGSITVTGATVEILRGWRFTGTDAISGTSAWKMTTRTAPAINATGPIQENGIVVKISEPQNQATFAVTTPHGDFTFTSQEVPFGTAKTFLNGKAVVTRTGAQFQLTNSSEDDDFPAMARSGDDVYLAYVEYTHGDRSQAVGQGVSQPITDFSFLARPVGGDQVLLMHYSISQRTWTGPYAITASGEDIMRTAVAIDGQGRAWVFYSANRSGNFDVFAKNARADGSVSPEVRITSDAGTDLFPAAATDANGTVWVTWQGYRNGNLEVLASVQKGDAFWPETIVSTSPASDWDPAIAAAPNGEVAISWDTYDKGDFDVYVRRVHFDNAIIADAPIPIAASPSFEARSSLAYDPQNRLWIAYEVAGSAWGKDFGAFDTTGLPLYSSHTVEVRCLIGNDVYQTTDDVSRVLPGAPATEFFATKLQGTPLVAQPDPTIATKRQPNANAGPPTGPRNNFPRIAVDSEGTVYLAFRERAGLGWSHARATGGVSVGSIWIGGMVYYDGAQWQGPGVLAFTDAVSDNRPAIIGLGPGRLLIAHSTDHRLSPPFAGTPQNDSVQSDIFQSELTVTRTQQSPQLQKIGPVTPAPADASVVAELAQETLSRNYRPVVSGQRYYLLRGDFHRHSEISFDGGGDGPLVDAYRYYIDAAGLGWAGCCDHDNGEAREYTWWIIQKYTDAFQLLGRYVPMFYYERSVSYPEGHRNVIFGQRGVRTLPRLPLSSATSSAPAPDTTMLYAYLHFFNGMSAPHTGATDQGTDYRNSDGQVEPFVEIYQGDRQDYEMPGAPRANTPSDSISGYEAAGYVANALAKGIQYGFEASSDHISTHISFSNLWVKELSRAGVMDAIRNRRMYGSTDNIVADFRSAGHFMGEAFTTSGTPVFTIRLWGTAPFQNIVVVKDNNIVYSTSGGRAVAFSWQDQTAQKGKTSYYYVRGQQTDGQIVWVSPMWVTLQ